MPTDYGNRLRSARRDAGLTQVQLSQKTGIPQSTISTAEREGHSSGETPTYAKACGVDAHWLATGDGERNQDSGWPFTLFNRKDYMLLPKAERDNAENSLAGAILRVKQTQHVA